MISNKNSSSKNTGCLWFRSESFLLIPALQPGHVSSPDRQETGKENTMRRRIPVIIFQYPTVVPSALYPSRSQQKVFVFLVLFFLFLLPNLRAACATWCILYMPHQASQPNPEVVFIRGCTEDPSLPSMGFCMEPDHGLEEH